MPETDYFGGTVDRSVASREIVSEVKRHGRKAFVFSDRKTCGDSLVIMAVPATVL
jgi:UDP-N-acetylmuramate--alanine ligase